MNIEERLYSKTRISSKFGLIRALDEEGLLLVYYCALNTIFKLLLFFSWKDGKGSWRNACARLSARLRSKGSEIYANVVYIFVFRCILICSWRESTVGDIKKQTSRIHSILKEKRETISEFIKKKREICLSNMNIFNKREETERLEDFIKNEKESLKARKFVSLGLMMLTNLFPSKVLRERLDNGELVHQRSRIWSNWSVKGKKNAKNR